MQNDSPKHGGNTSEKELRIRSSIRLMVEDGIPPFSIVAAHGIFVTPDEADYLTEYEKRLNSTQPVAKGEAHE